VLARALAGDLAAVRVLGTVRASTISWRNRIGQVAVGPVVPLRATNQEPLFYLHRHVMIACR
jgi:hypothetical protein